MHDHIPETVFGNGHRCGSGARGGSVAGVYISKETVSSLLASTAQQRVQGFVTYLEETNGAVEALLHGISRDPELESEIRSVALASGLTNFTVFDLAATAVRPEVRGARVAAAREPPAASRAREARRECRRAARRLERSRPVRNRRSLVISPVERDGTRQGFVSMRPT